MPTTQRAFNAFDFEKHRTNLITDLSKLIQIPSVTAPQAPGAPFGAEINRALEFMLERGRALGFRTKNVSGYGGHIEYGDGGPIVGILVHIDVVPAGDGWVYGPFDGTVESGRIYGRGASDDKGPAVAALYSLKTIADHVAEPHVRWRLILGTDEETGWRGITRYFEEEQVPDVGFSPDATYPLYNREMGIIDIELAAKRTGTRIVDTLVAGSALNMVPDTGHAVLVSDFRDAVAHFATNLAVFDYYGRRLHYDSATGRLLSQGRSAHGGVPHHGHNAAAVLLDVVTALAGAKEAGRGPSTVEPEIQSLRRLIGYETQGHSLGIAAHDEESGPLSVNLGRLEVSEERVTCGLNIRYPVTESWERIGEALDRRVEPFGFSSRVINHLGPLFVPEDSPIIRSLLGSYKAVTGVEERPRAMPGGTYARVLRDRGVAFGAGFEGEDNRAHRPDEFVTIDRLLRHGLISTQALYDLGRLF